MYMYALPSDTAFMFVIVGLLLVKLFQNRHPDMHTNAFIAFFCFAVVIFFTLLGIVSYVKVFRAVYGVGCSDTSCAFKR